MEVNHLRTNYSGEVDQIKTKIITIIFFYSFHKVFSDSDVRFLMLKKDLKKDGRMLNSSDKMAKQTIVWSDPTTKPGTGNSGQHFLGDGGGRDVVIGW